MYKTNPLLIEKCRNLRNKGFTLGEIVKVVRLPKTTVYEHVRNAVLSQDGQKRLERVKKRIRKENTKRINDFHKKRRSKNIKYLKGKKMLKPKYWSKQSIFLIAHFMFDGRIHYGGCEYYNRNDYLIQKMKQEMQKLLGLDSKIYPRDLGVQQIRYYYAGLGFFMKRKAQELLNYIKNTSLQEKKIFLRAFFDDEGCVSWWKKGNKRLVRGFQHNLEILKLIQKLLNDFDIKSKIDKKYKELVISRKGNLIKFRDKINFSKSIYINPERKNSIWKQKLEKREILNKIINSYKK